MWAAQNKAKRLALLEKAIVENPDSLFCHYNLANHLKILGEYARAIAHYVPCFDGDLSLDWVKMSFFSASLNDVSLIDIVPSLLVLIPSSAKYFELAPKPII